MVGITEALPARRIYCIGRNYAAHAIERDSDPTREPPLLLPEARPTRFRSLPSVPSPTIHTRRSNKNYHHEVELVAALKSGGTNIPADKALDCVHGHTLGLDTTRRDLQNAMGTEKKPWEIDKSFDHSAVLGPTHPMSQDRTPHQGRNLARGERHGAVEFGPDQDDLDGRRTDFKLSEAFELKAGYPFTQARRRMSAQ